MERTRKMRLAIRNGTFETNSSSVHAFVYLSSAAYDYWTSEKDTVLLFDHAWEVGDKASGGIRDGSCPEHAIDASGFVIGRGAYDFEKISLEGRPDFTYEQACALNGTDREYEADSFKEESPLEGGWMLEFDYFE